jgi:integrase
LDYWQIPHVLLPICYSGIFTMVRKIKLTKRAVEAVPTPERTAIIWDTELKGFGLKVTSRGRRVYFLYYRTRSGQQRRPTVGVHGSMTPDEARQIARKWLLEVANGRDVSAERKADRKAEKVSDLAARYLAEYAELHKKPSSISADQAIIVNHINPQIGPLKIKDVKRVDIERCMMAIRDGRTARLGEPARKRGRRNIRGGHIIANRAVALLSKMFACATAWDLVDSNPAQGIRKYREKRRDRFLDREEIVRLLDTLATADSAATESSFVTAAIRFLLWTGMRSGEVRYLTWQNVDFDNACLRIPNSKTGARTIPLSSYALAILKSMSQGMHYEMVFQGFQTKRPITLTRPWYRIRAAAKLGNDVTLHTLRHTFASWSVMNGQSLAQVGAVLGHKAAQTTLRYADHRLEALRSYSEQTGNVIANMQMRTAILGGT